MQPELPLGPDPRRLEGQESPADHPEVERPSPGRRTNAAQAPEPGRGGPAVSTVTVAQLTAMVRQAIEVGLPPTLHVVGEISNFKRHSSGHCYFTLKDPYSEMPCVMWRSSAAGMKFEPANGLEVVATGSVEVFEKAGRYQFYARRLEPRGVGALELAFRQLHEKLSREGLFDERHKKSLPPYPELIALVTSPTGAAVADMLRNISRRYPCVHVLVYPVRVQGPGAAEEIARAICRLNQESERLGGLDLLIVGRGGGSLEDLWAFNEENVARAIFASRIPVICGVGHEVDVTIADLVADVRAATPTAAVEVAVPVRAEILASLDARERALRRRIVATAEMAAARMRALTHRACYKTPEHLLHRREQRLDELSARLTRCLLGRSRSRRHRVDELEAVVQRISPFPYLLRQSGRLRKQEDRLAGAVRRVVEHRQRRALRAAERLGRVSPERAVARWHERLALAERVLGLRLRHRAAMLGERLSRGQNVLEALSHRSVLARGFSITRTKRGRLLVRDPGGLADGDRIVTELAGGEVESEVVNRRQMELFD